MSLVACCFPISQEAQMLKACYPPAKQLPATSAPLSADDSSYKPLSQELSRLTYYASNKPGKLNRLAEELEERVAKEGRKAKAGYGKHRIYLLISLSIARALVTECRTDLSLFSRSIIRIIDTGLTVAVSPYLAAASSAAASPSPSAPLAARSVDLEVALRAGALFAAFETYADSQVLGADAVGVAYTSVLRKLARISGANGVSHHGSGASKTQSNGNVGSLNEKEQEKDDDETRNRTRLVALAALSSAVQSETTFSAGAEFEQIIQILVPALLENIWLGKIDEIHLETAKAEIDASPSPFFREFSTRPPLRERRAPSLHAHVPGEKGPFTSDVVGAALRTLRRLLGQSHVSQISTIVLTMFAWLDAGRRWQDAEKCRWLSESATSSTMLQYRYAVPSTMLDLLAAEADVSQPTAKHQTLLSALAGVLSQSKTSLVGISTTEILGVIVSLILRRCKISPEDSLLPQLVEAVDALGGHVYYADQANDLVEDLAARIARVQAAGPHSAASSLRDRAEEVARQATLRVLVSCLASLLVFAQSEEPALDVAAGSVDRTNQSNGQITNTASKRNLSGPKRNPVSPEVWQETLPLLCESSFALRAEYAKALSLYLEQELPFYIRSEEPDDVEGVVLFEDSSKEGVRRFMHALFATLYTLAVSSSLGYAGPSLSVPLPTAEERDETTELANIARQPTRLRQTPGETPFVESPAESSASLPRKAATPSKDEAPRLGGRRMSKLVSLPLNRLDGERPGANFQSSFTTAAEDSAGPGDYAIFCHLFQRAVDAAPEIATLDGFPMLLALDRDAPTQLKRSNRTADSQTRIAACREVAAMGRSILVKTWGGKPPPGLPYSGPGLSGIVPQYHLRSASSGLQAPEQWSKFASPPASSHSQYGLDANVSVGALAACEALTRAAGLGRTELEARLQSPWSTMMALQNSIEQNATKKRDPRERLATDEADRLRTISTQSSRSVLQSVPRPVDIADLRDALGGGQGSIAPKSAAPTVSTVQTRHRSDMLDAATTDGERPLKSLTQADVHNLLQDIVRDKSKHKKSAEGIAAIPSD